MNRIDYCAAGRFVVLSSRYDIICVLNYTSMSTIAWPKEMTV